MLFISLLEKKLIIETLIKKESNEITGTIDFKQAVQAVNSANALTVAIAYGQDSNVCADNIEEQNQGRTTEDKKFYPLLLPLPFSRGKNSIK